MIFSQIAHIFHRKQVPRQNEYNFSIILYKTIFRLIVNLNRVNALWRKYKQAYSNKTKRGNILTRSWFKTTYTIQIYFAL